MATPTGSGDRAGASALAAIVRHRRRLLAVAALCGIAGFAGGSAALTPSYSATAVVTLSSDRPFDPQGNSGPLGDPTKWATAQSGVAQSRAVFDRARQRVPAREREEFRDQVEILPNNEFNQVAVTATAADAADAAAVADAVALAYRELRADTVRTQTAQALTQVSDAATRQRIQLASVTYGDGVAILDNAEVPTSPSSLSPLALGALTGLAGLLASGAFVAWRAHVRQRVAGSPLPDVAELGRWPSAPSLQALADPHGAQAQSGGVVLVGIQHLGHLRTPRLEVGSILVTAVSGEGGGLAVALAAAAARSGRRVVLVDADERGSRLSAFNAPVDVQPAGRRAAVDRPRPWVIGVGATVDVLALGVRHLQPRAVGLALQQLVEDGYLVIVVGGSVLDSPAAFAVAGEVDAVLVQVEPEPSADLVSKTVQRLQIAAPAVVAQVVVEDAAERLPLEAAEAPQPALRRAPEEQGGVDKIFAPTEPSTRS
ncbi:hypothetical protein NUM3379_34330 [Kineococcus sp. NUM-3379]